VPEVHVLARKRKSLKAGFVTRQIGGRIADKNGWETSEKGTVASGTYLTTGSSASQAIYVSEREYSLPLKGLEREDVAVSLPEET